MGVISMIPYKTFAVVGGDLRQAHIANRLASMGKTVYAMLLEQNKALDYKLWAGLEQLPNCEAVILPMPLSSDEETIHTPFSKEKIQAESLFSKIRPDAKIFAGRVTSKMAHLAEHYGLKIHDYLDREELAVKNAGITAESAIALAIQEVPISLIGANVLITGYGRISKALLQRLPAMGARVYIAARKCADRAEITARGCKSLSMDLLPQAAAAADIIMNTVPAPLFTKEVLCAVKSESLLIDLASKPGGVAFDAARELGVRTIWALSLPGKTAPISAGEIILETIENCLTEQEAG